MNRSLQKEAFDCSNIGDFYDCGCADEDKEGPPEVLFARLEMAEDRKAKLLGGGRRVDDGHIKDLKPPELEKEGFVWTFARSHPHGRPANINPVEQTNQGWLSMIETISPRGF